MSEAAPGPNISLPFPIEFLIRDTPCSLQGKNARGKELWKRRVGDIARAHVNALREWIYLDERPLAATIFYFPPAPLEGDVDNIVKLILDGMLSIVYPDDRLLERVTVQKFEPGVEAVFHGMTPALEQATETEPPVIYIRIDDDLRWREIS